MKNPPEITEEMKAEAKNRLGGYMYCIDPIFAKDGVNGAIPPEGIIGAYLIDDAGNIIEEFQANPNYKQN